MFLFFFMSTYIFVVITLKMRFTRKLLKVCYMKEALKFQL